MRLLRLVLWCLALVAPAWAGEPGPAALAPPAESFSARLSEEERATAGLLRLSDEERAALDAQIARELRAARQGDTVAFAGTFITRRPPSEAAAAGLGGLTPEEAAALNRLVARALAERPVNLMPRTRVSGAAIETVTRRPQWHGEITATYGRSSGGGEFYGGSVTTVYDDPDRGFTAALTLAEYRGNGWYGSRYGDPCYRDGWGRDRWRMPRR